MQLHRGLALLAFAFTTLASPSLVQAATAECMSPDGTCSVSNDGFDWLECMCADGNGGGGGGGNEWAGLSELELLPICEEQLASFCGPFVPPEYVECWGGLGSCTIDNEPEDELECWCADGTTPGNIGGNMWAGWDDMMLFTECEAQLDALCLPPPGSLECMNTNGQCWIDNQPMDFLACDCGGGDGGSFGGGNAWAGYDEGQLYDQCGLELVSFCGGPLPPPLWLECSSSLGECIIDNDPEDLLECTCADGQMIASGGGNTWAGLSDEELFMECEEQLYEGCGVSAESGSGSDSGDSGDSTGGGDSSSSGSAGSTGEPPADTGIDGSGSEGSTGGTPPPAGTGDDTTGGGSEGSDGGAADGGGGSGCSCSTDGRSEGGGWALMLLGLVGVGFGRRRARAHERG
jgi:MYXO-CTERM domain-containing protein